MEEVARFVLEDAELAGRLKAARHFVRRTTQELGGSVSALMEARESNDDVGRPSSTSDSSVRDDAAQIVTANMRRAQEGMRVLEELSAFFDTEKSNSIKQCRFELYSLEKEMIEHLESTAGA